MYKKKPKTTLKTMLFEKNMSMSELARKIGLSVSSISLASDGVASEETRKKIAEGLEVEVNDLWPDPK